jgi:hypothetical protein
VSARSDGTPAPLPRSGMWSEGDVVAVREIWRGRVWKARPWIVVHDRPDALALFIPRGTPTMIPPGSGIPRDEWTLEQGQFDRDTLRLTQPGAAHSVLLFWIEDRFEGWYVNFERPLTRSRVGFDYLDLELDLYVRPNRSIEMLDEEEFEEAQRLGVIDADEAAFVLAEAARVRGLVERWESPFRDGWESWRPNASWPIPGLSSGWDLVP